MNHDRYETDILRALQAIAKNTEKIAAELKKSNSTYAYCTPATVDNVDPGFWEESRKMNERNRMIDDAKELVSKGYTNADIANELHIDDTTIRVGLTEAINAGMDDK